MSAIWVRIYPFGRQFYPFGAFFNGALANQGSFGRRGNTEFNTIPYEARLFRGQTDKGAFVAAFFDPMPGRGMAGVRVDVTRALLASLAQASFRISLFFFCFARGSRDLGTPT
jgi:hypothetical protein